jgi:hypothetical protein
MKFKQTDGQGEPPGELWSMRAVETTWGIFPFFEIAPLFPHAQPTISIGLT